MPEWFFVMSMGLFGLVFGSFANVVIWRFPRGESVSYPPSACPRCSTPIKAYDNIPVISWLLLRGRCRSCGAPISIRYPLIEAFSAALWVVASVRFGVGLESVVCAAMFYLLLILSMIDLDTMRLPNRLVGILAAVGYAAALVTQVSDVPAAPLLPSPATLSQWPVAVALLGSVASAGIALALALGYAAARKRSGFGMGDVKLLAALGPFLGLYGVFVLFVGSIFGALYGVASAMRDRESLAKPFPFGPFLALAAALVVLFGPQTLQWYLGLVGS